MISSLIVPPKSKSSESVTSVPSTAVQNCARLFIGSMGDNQRERFKKMLQSGVQCGESIAKSYGVPLNEFIAEVEKII